MKRWDDFEEVDADLPDQVFDVSVAVRRAIAGGGIHPLPTLLWLGAGDPEEDCWRYELEIELTPGLTIPVESGLFDPGTDLDEVGPDDVADEVAEALGACAPRLAGLADILHDARIRTRRKLADWGRSGLDVRLIAVRLAPYDHWRGQADPSLQVLLEGLDDRLEPVTATVPVERPSELDGELERARLELAASRASRTALLAMGASGTIDQLALNALAWAGDQAAGLRRLGREWRFWLEDQTAIVTMNGHVHAGSGSSNTRVQWCGGYLTVEGLTLPAQQLARASGLPVSGLFAHPFLSDDMTVVEAENVTDEHGSRLQVKFVNPRKAFCSASGRVWDVADETIIEGANATPGGNVVQFARRRPTG